jgi:hypothetical protein
VPVVVVVPVCIGDSPIGGGYENPIQKTGFGLIDVGGLFFRMEGSDLYSDAFLLIMKGAQ